MREDHGDPQWCYTPAVWREWKFQVRSTWKQSLWQNQNKFSGAWKCQRTSLVSCSWPHQCCLDQQPASPAARHRSLPPTFPPRESQSAASSLQGPEPAPKVTASWQGRAGKLEGQFQGCRTRGKSKRAQLQHHPLQRWKSMESTHGDCSCSVNQLSPPGHECWQQVERSRESLEAWPSLGEAGDVVGKGKATKGKNASRTQFLGGAGGRNKGK